MPETPDMYQSISIWPNGITPKKAFQMNAKPGFVRFLQAAESKIPWTQIHGDQKPIHDEGDFNSVGCWAFKHPIGGIIFSYKLIGSFSKKTQYVHMIQNSTKDPHLYVQKFQENIKNNPQPSSTKILAFIKDNTPEAEHICGFHAGEAPKNLLQKTPLDVLADITEAATIERQQEWFRFDLGLWKRIQDIPLQISEVDYVESSGRFGQIPSSKYTAIEKYWEKHQGNKLRLWWDFDMPQIELCDWMSFKAVESAHQRMELYALAEMFGHS